MLGEIHLQFINESGMLSTRTELVEVRSETELHNLAYQLQAQERAENVNFNFVEEGDNVI